MEYEVDLVMNCLERRKADIFIKDIYPWIKGVRIHGSNECTQRFCKLMFQYSIPFEILNGESYGEFPNYAKKERLEIPEENIINIYMRENQKFIDANRLTSVYFTCFMKQVGRLNHIWITEKYRKVFLNKGICMLTAYFPMLLSSMSKEEEYRQKRRICIGSNTNIWNDKYDKEQMLKVLGKEATYEEWEQAQLKKQKNFIYLDNTAVTVKYFGEHKNHLYVIGPCIANGSTVLDDKESFGGCLYHWLEQKGAEYSVVCIVFEMQEFYLYEKIFQSLAITTKDIVLVINNVWDEDRKYIECSDDIQMKMILERRTCDWFYDCPIHTNSVGNMKISQIIVEEYLLPLLKDVKKEAVFLQLGKTQLDKSIIKDIDDYLDKIKRTVVIGRDKHIGAIVMNCNPMTRGHLYLIREASKQVDYLYIFVVEENASEFRFEERYKLVKDETKTLNNITVVPSGEFVLSATTLPLYFEKAEKKDAKLDASVDLQIFGEYIAPGLGITTRFVGEEPIDMVTKQYNQQMKSILPYYGVNIIEIPRQCINGIPISASKVRELLKKGAKEELKMYVTDNVFDFLIKQQ